MAKTQARASCELCAYESNKAGMTRHLATCPAKHDASKAKLSKLYRLRVEAEYAPTYFLDIELKANAKLEDLDSFLRDIWLECCGHLSMFSIGNTQYDASYEEDEEMEQADAEHRVWLENMWRERGIPESKWPAPRLERGMDTQVEAIFETGLSFSYEYDFGSTTHLKLKVVSEREGRITGKLRLLARNHAPNWECSKCSAPAVVIHTEKMWEDDYPFFCKKHARGWDDYPYMPVVNSPRMGVCGYTG